MNKILVTGANGQLGSQLKAELEKNKESGNFIFCDLPELDITDSSSVKKFVWEKKVGTIINCAAYTAVDKAESDIAAAARVNHLGAAILADIAVECDLTLIHISTDYVFDGKGYKPYTEEDIANPGSAYGKTKRDGECAIINSKCKGIIIRTSWLYSGYGMNFVKTMYRLGAEREDLTVVNDQIGTPTNARDLAHVVLKFLTYLETNPLYGEIFHYSNEGACSWYDFARKIMEFAGYKCKVEPISSVEYNAPANRPYYSLLCKTKIRKTLNIEIPHWEDSLKSLLSEK